MVDTVHDETLAHDGIVIRDVDSLEALMKGPRWRAIWRGERDELDYVVWALLAYNVGRDLHAGGHLPVGVLVDEIWDYCDPRKMTSKSAWKHLVKMARHRSLYLVMCTQRPADIHKDLVAESALWIGPVQEPNDLKYLGDIPAVTDEVLERVAALEPPEMVDGKLHLRFVTVWRNNLGLEDLIV